MLSSRLLFPMWFATWGRVKCQSECSIPFLYCCGVMLFRHAAVVLPALDATCIISFAVISLYYFHHSLFVRMDPFLWAIASWSSSRWIPRPSDFRSSLNRFSVGQLRPVSFLELSANLNINEWCHRFYPYCFKQCHSFWELRQIKKCFFNLRFSQVLGFE